MCYIDAMGKSLQSIIIPIKNLEGKNGKLEIIQNFRRCFRD